MDKYRCEMFGHFTYDERLTYQELLDRETKLTQDMQLLLDQSEAVHIDFTPLGDELMVQCAFAVYNVQTFHTLCDAAQTFLCDAVEARLLFVDKHLASVDVYWVTNQGWQEASLDIPKASTAVSQPAPVVANKLAKQGTKRKKKQT